MDIEQAKKIVNKLNWSHFDMSEDSSEEYIKAIGTVLEELENKQDDINILQAQRDSMEYQFKQAKLELEKKDKMIDEMAKMLVEVPINSSDTPATAAAKAEICKDLEILKNALINYISEKIEGEE